MRGFHHLAKLDLFFPGREFRGPLSPRPVNSMRRENAFPKGRRTLREFQRKLWPLRIFTNLCSCYSGKTRRSPLCFVIQQSAPQVYSLCSICKDMDSSPCRDQHTHSHKEGYEWTGWLCINFCRFGRFGGTDCNLKFIPSVLTLSH